MDKTYKHIGYYNDFIDCNHLFDKSADYVVAYMKAYLGSFHKVDFDEECTISEVSEEDKDVHFFEKTTDGVYYVRYEKGNDKGEGWYIDIYKSVESDNKVQEYCGYCEEYVLLDPELKVQKCPNCGKAIVPCGSLCPMLTDENSVNRNCACCPLSKLCDEMNEDIPSYKGKHLTLMETAFKFNTATLEEKKKGLHITVPKMEDNECDEEIFIHYNQDYDCIVVLDVAQYTLAYTIKPITLDRVELKKALLAMFNRTVEKLYVRQNY